MAYLDKRKKNNNGKKQNKIITKLSYSTIINLIYYAISPSEYISNTNLSNLLNLLDSIDVDKSYTDEKDLSIKQYFHLLHETVKLNLKEVVSDTYELMDFLEEETDEEYLPNSIIQAVLDDDAIENNKLSDKKIIYWNQYIQEKLDYISIYQDIPSLEEIVESFKYSDPEKTKRIIPQAKEVLINLNKKFNNNSMNYESTRNSFNILDRNNARSVIKNSLVNKFNPGNRIPTGYQMLDEMLGGGLSEERCYLLLGIPKGAKSGTVLNIVMNIATNYVDYQLKDPNKIPCILYFTMENSMNETFERIYNYLGIDFNFDYEIVKNKMGKEIKKYKISETEVDEILDVIMKATYDKTGIALRIEFKEHMSVDTGILDKFYDDYSLLDNQELIFVAQDYIKRIHSQRSYKTEQKRDELGEVINEFCNFAKSKKIPVLTISQLNRTALATVESAKESKKKDLARKLGGSQVGESNLIYENADYTIVTNKEDNEDDGRVYQTFKLIMARGKSNKDYFAQPYDPDPKYNNFRIATDIDLPEPLGIDRISSLEDANDIKEKENTNEAIKNRRQKRVKATIDLSKITENDGEEEEFNPLQDLLNEEKEVL